MNTSPVLPFILSLLFLSIVNFSCTDQETMELAPEPRITASIFNSDTNLSVLGNAYEQYQNTNPASESIVDFVTDFASSKAYKTSFLVNKQDEEHIIWSLGEIQEADGTTFLIAPVVNSSQKEFTKTLFMSRKNGLAGLEYQAAVEKEKSDGKMLNDYFSVKAFHLSLGKDEHKDRSLNLILPKNSKNTGNKNEVCYTITVQITYWTDTWQNDYGAYLDRDYDAPSYLGASNINQVYTQRTFCYFTDGTYTTISGDDGSVGTSGGFSGGSSGSGGTEVPFIGPNDRIPTPCLEADITSDRPVVVSTTIAGFEANFRPPGQVRYVNLNVPVLCVSIRSSNGVSVDYMRSITSQIFSRTLNTIQRQYRNEQFNHITTTALLNNEFSLIFRREAEDLVPDNYRVHLDMNNFCSDFNFDTGETPSTISWDC